MISSIEDKKNDNNELSEHFQDAETVIRQKLNATFEKITQFKMRNNNEKIFNHEFNENDAADYIAFIEKKRARSKNLKIKKEC